MPQLPYWQTHGGAGPHLLLVHGFLSSQSQWLLNIDALRAFCQPVTIELFGHARSPTPTDPVCYTPDYYVACFETIRKKLGCERWFLLGYSMGAGLTLLYALTHPDRTVGHLFTNSTSGLADPALQKSWRENASSASENIRSGGQTAMLRIPVHPKHARRLPDDVKKALLEDAERHTPEGVANTLAVTNPSLSMRARLKENARPACLIQGAKEKRFSDMADYAESHMPHLKVEKLDAGHGMNMELPAEFNARVQKFIESCLTS